MRRPKLAALLPLLLLAVAPAEAHVGAGATASFPAGLAHPFSGLDHMLAMVTVGLWATLRGGRALWAWPAAFVGVMLAGTALASMQVAMPLVEPGILASVVALGLLVALAIDLPVWSGALVVGLFALFHGHAHGAGAPAGAGGLEYMAGLAVATALLHAAGVALGLGFGARLGALVRAGGAACAVMGLALAFGVV